jgi:hypothetical protein
LLCRCNRFHVNGESLELDGADAPTMARLAHARRLEAGMPLSAGTLDLLYRLYIDGLGVPDFPDI